MTFILLQNNEKSRIGRQRQSCLTIGWLMDTWEFLFSLSSQRCLKLSSAFLSSVLTWLPANNPFSFCPIQCSKSCQGGFRVREVRCLSDDMTLSNLCDPQLKPEERESCNTQDCVPEVGK